jgi:hypothetical protein
MMAFPKLWEKLFGSNGGTTLTPTVLPDAEAETKGAVTLNDVVTTGEQTLTEAVQNVVLTKLGVFSALESLITEYGGTVPTDESGS